MSLIQLGDFTLASGAQSTFKLECDQFIEDNIDGLVALIRHMVGPYKEVHGVPRGGLRLAEALRPFTTPDGVRLIIEDVLTTGGSMQRFTNELYAIGSTAWRECAGVAVFARGPCPAWTAALFMMPECFWVQPKT